MCDQWWRKMSRTMAPSGHFVRVLTRATCRGTGLVNDPTGHRREGRGRGRGSSHQVGTPFSVSIPTPAFHGTSELPRHQLEASPLGSFYTQLVTMTLKPWISGQRPRNVLPAHCPPSPCSPSRSGPSVSLSLTPASLPGPAPGAVRAQQGSHATGRPVVL